MCAESATQNFRGVLCRRCGKPVRVPSLVMKHETACQEPHESTDTHYHLISRVFVLRCRACEKESIYAINQIIDCSYSQPTPAPNQAAI